MTAAEGTAWPVVSALAQPAPGDRVAAAAGALILVEGVEKAFGSLVALAGVDLVVERGTVLGLGTKLGGQIDAGPHPVDAAAAGRGEGMDSRRRRRA